MIKEKIKKFKEWLIIKLGGYVSWMEAKTVVNYYTITPIIYELSYTPPLNDILDEEYIKNELYSKARTDILPRISKITSETNGNRKEYKLTIKAIQENDNDAISG